MVFNAIMVKGDYIGETMFYGKVQEKMPASAVVGDIIDIVKNLNQKQQQIGLKRLIMFCLLRIFIFILYKVLNRR